MAGNPSGLGYRLLPDPLGRSCVYGRIEFMASPDVVPVDYNSPVGKIRALIGDFTLRTDPLTPGVEDEYLFTDDQINSYLSIANDSIHYAAAHALDVLAVNEALVSKKMRTEAGLSTDGPAVAKALQDTANRLREQGTAIRDEEAEANTSHFEVVDYSPAFSLGVWGPWSVY